MNTRGALCAARAAERAELVKWWDALDAIEMAGGAGRRCSWFSRAGIPTRGGYRPCFLPRSL